MVKKSERRVLVISELITGGRKNLTWLYSFLDQNGSQLAKSMLESHYAEVKILTGPQVTPVKCVKALEALCNKPGTKAVDMMIQVHGTRKNIRFYGEHGYQSVASFSAMIAARDLKDRLRLCYSLACYGGLHNHLWLEAGFVTASGARGINCNSATDVPAQLHAWTCGEPYSQCVISGNSQPGLGIADAAGAQMGFPKPDSFKVIKGKKTITIASSAT